MPAPAWFGPALAHAQEADFRRVIESDPCEAGDGGSCQERNGGVWTLREWCRPCLVKLIVSGLDCIRSTRQPGDLLSDEERLRLLLVIDAEAGSDHADREAERLGLTIQLAVARERRAVRGDGA